MRVLRARRAIGIAAAALLASVALAWSGRRSNDFCADLRQPRQGPPNLAADLERFVAIAPGEIRADAAYVRDFTRAMLTTRFPGASGPGVGILSMNPDFVAAQERIAAYVEKTCGIPARPPTADAAPTPSDPARPPGS